MKAINLSIGRSKYQINCPDGEEDKITKLASRLNERVNQLLLSLGNTDEKTVLMLCAITMIDEMENLKKKIGKNHHDENDSDKTKLINEAELYSGVAENMKNIADYIEKLTNKIKHY